MIILWSFYRKAALLLTFTTLLDCLLLYLKGSLNFLIPLFWFKLAVTVVVAAYILIFDNAEFAFYRNIGYRRRVLFSALFAIDLMIWCLLNLITVQLFLHD